jgi:hypothetical protein
MANKNKGSFYYTRKSPANNTAGIIANEQKHFMQVLKFSNYTVPEFVEVRGKPWIYYGKDNNYPDYLINLFNRSAKHNALVTGKKEYITGNGWHVDEAGLSTAQSAAVLAFAKQANVEETLDDILEKAALDLEIFGGFALQIIYTKGTNRIAEIYHVDFSKIRAGHDGAFYYFSNDWTKTHQSLEDTGLKGFNAFNPSKPGGTQLLYFKEYRPRLEVYPIPDYTGCIPYIEIDYEIANYHLNNIKNGFWASFMINFNNGIPTIEEQETIERQIRKKFTGTDNAGRFVLNFTDDKSEAPTLLPLQTPDIDKQFALLNDSVQQEIFTGHKITSPMLFGIKTSGQLGGRDELREASELFQNTYVNHKQQLLNRVFNSLLQANGIKTNPLRIVPTTPLSWQLPDAIIATAMTKDEVRENIGLKPLQIKGVSDVLPPFELVKVPGGKL